MNELTQPFFVRFLEAQREVEEANQLGYEPTKPLVDAHTEKWPSDWDEV
jgi:hypothetical protein